MKRGNERGKRMRSSSVHTLCTAIHDRGNQPFVPALTRCGENRDYTATNVCKGFVVQHSCVHACSHLVEIREYSLLSSARACLSSAAVNVNLREQSNEKSRF